MTEPREIAFDVKQQGAPLVNSAHVVYESDACICIEVDMKSKYCNIDASSGHGVFVGAKYMSLHLAPGVDREHYTWVEFTLPEGNWNFFTGGSSRYTLYITYLKEQA